MPIPGYLICYQSGAVDDVSKAVSFFQVCEKLQMFRFQAQAGQVVMVPLNPLRITTYWMKEDEDPADGEFEVEIVAIFPNGPAEIRIGHTTFRFTEQTQRLNVVGWQPNQFYGNGILRVEGRIRQSGETAWAKRISFPIIIEEGQLPAAPAAS